MNQTTGETVVVPAGQFPQVVMQISQVTAVLSGRQSDTVQIHTTSWYAPKVGLVRQEIDTSPTQEKIADELVSFEY